MAIPNTIHMKILYPIEHTLKSNPYPLMLTRITSDNNIGWYTFLIIGKYITPSVNTDMFLDVDELNLMDRMQKNGYLLYDYADLIDAMKGIEEWYALLEHHQEYKKLVDQMSIPCLDNGEREEIQLECEYIDYLQQQEYEQQARLNGQEENRMT